MEKTLCILYAISPKQPEWDRICFVCVRFAVQNVHKQRRIYPNAAPLTLTHINERKNDPSSSHHHRYPAHYLYLLVIAVSSIQNTILTIVIVGFLTILTLQRKFKLP